MKPVIGLVATIVLSLAFAPAFADDFATMGGTDVGLVMYEAGQTIRESPPTQITAVEPYPFCNIARDVGLALYESHLASEVELAQRHERGIEAGGVSAKEVEKKFDYLGPGGSDLP